MLSRRRFLSYFSIVCWLEPEVGVAPGQTGLLRCAAARFSLAGLQQSSVVFLGRPVSEICGDWLRQDAGLDFRRT